MKSISELHNILYLNYTKDNHYSTYDGHHLDKFGSKLFSMDLGKIIKMNSQL